MKLEQFYIPDFNYCIMCSKECKSETCTSKCHWKLQKIRSIIDEKKEEERGGNGKAWNMVTLKKFRDIQDIIGK